MCDGYVQTIPLMARPIESMRGRGDYFARSLNALPDSTVSTRKVRERSHVRGRDFGPSRGHADLQAGCGSRSKFTRAWVRLAQLQASMRHTDDAATHFARRSRDPKQPVLYKVFAFTMMSLQREDDAIEAWQDLLKVAPDDADAPRISATCWSGGSATPKRFRCCNPRSSPIPRIRAQRLIWPSLFSYRQARRWTRRVAAGARPRQARLRVQQRRVGALPKRTRIFQRLSITRRRRFIRPSGVPRSGPQKLTPADLAHPSTLAAYWDTLGWVDFRLGHLPIKPRTI